MPDIKRTYVDPKPTISPWHQVVIDERDEARAEVERLKKGLEFTGEWYSTRWQRIADELRGTDAWPRVACIMANGTAEATEPPTYAQQMNLLKHEVERLRDLLRNLADAYATGHPLSEGLRRQIKDAIALDKDRYGAED